MNKRHLIFMILLLAGGWFGKASAQCTSSAGTVNTGNYQPCSTEGFIFSNQGAVLDSSDIKLFIIHDGTSTQIGNILWSSTQGFLFSFPPSMNVGTTYQAAVVVGNSLGGGQVDLNDPCLSVSGGITITIQSAPVFTVDLSGPLTCNGPDVVATATVTPSGPNYIYEWSGPIASGQGTSTATIDRPGFYFLFVTNNDNGCQSGDTVQVSSDNSFPTAAIAISNAQCNQATLTAITNNPAATYQWSNGVTNPSILVNTGGNYCVTVTSPEGCTATACRAFQSNGVLQVEIASFGNNICTDSLGIFAAITGFGTSQPYTYQWSNGATGPWQAPDQAGDYCVTVTDANGCTATDCFFVETDIDDCGTLQGRIFADQNTNCTFEAGDIGLNNFSILIENASGDQYFAYSDANGFYAVNLPTGNYTVTPVIANSPWASCQPSYSVTVVFVTPVTQDIPLQADELCPAMWVDVSMPFLRRCIGDNGVYVSYCNRGTETALAAYIDITLDAFLTIQSASVPYINLGSNVYRFELGDVTLNTCGNFSFRVSVNCDAQLGQTHCIEAVIFPNDPCPAPSPDWSGASVKLTAECTGDDLIFRATNVGTAAMTVPLNYVIIEDAVMLKMDPGAPLLAGEARVVFTTPANGATWRLECNQEPNHPGFSSPSLTVEGCTNNQTFSTGFVNQFPNDDNDPWIDIECRDNVGSYDPNDKQGFPTGFGAARYIRPGTDIEYLIRFQNTGTDTAFRVVIRDTLSQWLDPGSVVPGASSHPYTFRYYGDGYLKFEFDPILLPDSNVNVAGSQGFVTFRVSQKADVPLETNIFNKASIYFDGNDPIVTNTTVHRVGENFLSVSTWTPLAPGIRLTVAPNPAVDYAVLQVAGLEPGAQWQVEMVDAGGRAVLREVSNDTQWRLDRGTLPAGVYLIRLVQDGRLLGTGKVVLR
ncbi:MAG: T9SS type A sorting domain-containing protein [Saprospiraceae bacterium]|nr:T9SS type A sorting domain-containing protein [Saprospiraceae bacterium]